MRLFRKVVIVDGSVLVAWVDGLSHEVIRKMNILTGGFPPQEGDEKVLRTIKTKSLREAVFDFFGNLSNAGVVSSPLRHLFADGQRYERMEWLAREQITGRARANPDQPDAHQVEGEVVVLRDKLLNSEDRLVEPYHPPQEIGQVSGFGTLHQPGAIRHLIAGQIVLCWTAFEVFAKDVWVGALNAHPAGLSLLNGEPSRISKSAGRDKGEQKPKVPKFTVANLAAKTESKFDLQNRMGDLLAEELNFQTLPTIREAYSMAFADNDRKPLSATIDSALADQSLNALSSLRNVIVHRGGVADQKSAPLAPKATKGESVVVLTPETKGMVELAVPSSLKLVAAVERVINPSG